MFTFASKDVSKTKTRGLIARIMSCKGITYHNKDESYLHLVIQKDFTGSNGIFWIMQKLSRFLSQHVVKIYLVVRMLANVQL